MDVSIIIINYRTPHLILDCLRTVYQHTRDITFEVLVVDNDPAHGGGEQVRSAFPEVRWIDMDYNAGFGRANNAGMRQALGRYFLLLNADTLLVDNVIGRCVERMEELPDIVASSVSQKDQNGNTVYLINSFNELRRTLLIIPPGMFFQKVLEKLYPLKDLNDPKERDWLSGAFLLVRQGAFLGTGGFDEDFFMYGEDVEWCSRLGKMGKLYYFEDLYFIHLENNNPFRRTNVSWINRFSAQMQISNLLWIRKQYGIFEYLCLIFFYLLMIPVVYAWKMAINLKERGDLFWDLKTQRIFAKKSVVLVNYFWKTIFGKPYLYKIKTSENIDLLTK
jgi:GT2 family glycosyltransferase